MLEKASFDLICPTTSPAAIKRAVAKYLALQNFLETLDTDRWSTSFSEIEKLIDSSLPASARRHREWWANDQQNGRHWRHAGWRTETVNLAKETVVFLRQGPAVAAIVTRKAPKTKTPDDRIHQWDAPRKIAYSLKAEWKPIGRVVLNGERLVFPKAAAAPAIYRFRLRKGNKESVYIGETDNLKRRFGNYRNPGPSQRTSLRINGLLVAALKNGAEIAVSAILSDVQVDFGKGMTATNLSSKVARCMVENIAILDGNAVEIETLNKANM